MGTLLESSKCEAVARARQQHGTLCVLSCWHLGPQSAPSRLRRLTLWRQALAGGSVNCLFTGGELVLIRGWLQPHSTVICRSTLSTPCPASLPKSALALNPKP